MSSAPLVAGDEGFPPGTQLLSQYRVVRALGQGGMGAVYLACDDVSGQHVAVKVLPAALAREHGVRERFIQEARALAALDHPSIIPLITFATEGNDRFLVMKFVDGEALDSLIRRRGPLPFEEATSIIRSILDALGYAHSRGVVHRDVKPANVLLAKDGRVFLVDFGIAKQEQSTKLTQTGMLMGTPLYMSPEQISGIPLDGRSDLYSAGLMLFEMLCGRPPFLGDKTFAILRAHLEQAVPDPTALRGESIPPQLLQTIEALLQKAPERRPQTAAVALDLLSGASGAHPVMFSQADDGAGALPVAQSHATGAFLEPVEDLQPATPALSSRPPLKSRTVSRDELRQAGVARSAWTSLLVVLAMGIAVYVGVTTFWIRESDPTASEGPAKETTDERVARQEDATGSRTSSSDAAAETMLERQRYTEARQLLASDQPQAALDKLNEGAGDVPASLDATLLRIEALTSMKSFDDADRLIEELKQTHGSSPVVATHLARLQINLANAKMQALSSKTVRKKRAALPTDLSRAQLTTVTGRSRTRAQNCYQAHVLRRDPKAAGDVTIEATILPSGRVSEVMLVEQHVGGPKLWQCLQQIATRWRFPRFRDTPKILFQYTFSFRPDPG